MNILYYTSFNSRSRDTESLMSAFQAQGHNVFFLTQAEGREINSVLSKMKISVANVIVSENNKLWWLIRHVLFLVRFCRIRKIDVVFCHLEPPSFVGVLAQFFIKSKVIICRHHVDEIHLLGGNQSLSYKLIYKLGKQFIVVSRQAKEFMVQIEKVDPSKIEVINLSYDFSLYDKINEMTVARIREHYASDVLLITACRLVKDKRPDLSVLVLEKLLLKGINAKLLILGDGPYVPELKNLIEQKGLQVNCFLLGRITNILDYLSASDVLIHPSVLDSSSVIVKEAGLVSKIAVVCKGVGDFDDYLINKQNAVLVDKNDFVEETSAFLFDFINNPERYQNIGYNLKKDVYRLFSINNNIVSYNNYLK